MPKWADKGKDTAERAELDAVLASGTFDRAPLLSNFLTYICEKYFAGEADQIKEYSIATDALGRSEDFDHTRDSIVRVEAHRLRKRLTHYYEGPGADHELRIKIPTGQYVPQFVQQQSEPVAAPDEDRQETRPMLSDAKPRRGWMAVAAVFCLALLTFAVWNVSKADPDQNRIVAADLPADPISGPAIRINVGALYGVFVDAAGMVWGPDEYFAGGRDSTMAPPQELSGLPSRLFETGRFGRFEYKIPLAAGTYELRLYLADTGQGPRHNFDLIVNNSPLLENFEPAGSAGASGIADLRVFSGIRPASDGFLHLKVLRQGALYGLEILPAGQVAFPHRIRASKNSGYYDRLGRFWTGDRYYRGGSTANRSQRVAAATDPNLFTGERYGDFSYVLPASEGRHTLRLSFAETWYGPANYQGGGEGSRVFHVICNGQKLLTNFDIFLEAGGENRAIVKEFRGIEADSHGKVVVKFVPIKGNACVNAIELVPDSDC